MYDGGGAWKLKQKGGYLSNEDNPFLKDESDLPIASRWRMMRFQFGDTQPTVLDSQPHSFVKTQMFPHVWPGGSQVLADVLKGPLWRVSAGLGAGGDCVGSHCRREGTLRRSVCTALYLSLAFLCLSFPLVLSFPARLSSCPGFH